MVENELKRLRVSTNDLPVLLPTYRFVTTYLSYCLPTVLSSLRSFVNSLVAPSLVSVLKGRRFYYF